MGKKILIVDDSLVEIKILQSFLAETDYLITVARNGEEGEATAKTVAPDLIFLDVVMPKKNGFQVCRDLRKEPQFQQTPIIMFTSKSQDTDKFWGMQQGATDYITKPYEKQQILEILRQYLSREQAE